jgi:hypothetical protein
MSQNLMFRNDNVPADQAAVNWAAIKAVSNDDGMVFISDDTVASIARLLTNVQLTNGETVSTFHDEDDQYPANVSAFGASLLPVYYQDKVRDTLATGENGANAVRLFNETMRLGLQVEFAGKDFCEAHISGVNWVADEVTIRMSTSHMRYLITNELGIDAELDENGNGEVALDIFAKAVNDNVDLPLPSKLRLVDFVGCANRNNATHVYWA